MAFNIKTSLQAIRQMAENRQDVKLATIGQLRTVPLEKLVAVVFMAPEGVDVVRVTLAKTIEIHRVTLRLVMNLLRDDPEEIELLLAKVTSEIMEALCGDFDLGATIRNVDVAGQHSDGLNARWGNTVEEGAMWRFVDINIPLIVDDSASLVA